VSLKERYGLKVTDVYSCDWRYADMKSKYANFYYWENVIEKEGIEKVFAETLVTKDSVFFHGVIADCSDNSSVIRWICFPDVKALLGFIYYAFLPTAFINLLTNNDEPFQMAAPLNELLSVMSESDECVNRDLIPSMREFDELIYKLWDMERSECIVELKKMSELYEKAWNTRKDKFSYFRVFNSPVELGEYLVDSYSGYDDVDISDLEEQLEVSKDEWLKICAEVYENDFMRKKFADLLNNRVKDMV
jgi:hypothetical protein